MSSKNVNNFSGLDGHVCWIGVIENRSDPLGVGRAQVRIKGWHSPDKGMIPTADLPWAHPLNPINGRGSVPNYVEGDIVTGYFLDDDNGQVPVITGIVPGIATQNPPASVGFSDPRTQAQLVNSPRPVASSIYSQDGSGVVNVEATAALRNPQNINESTQSRLARNQNTQQSFLNTRLQNVVKGVPVLNEQLEAAKTTITSIKTIITSGIGSIIAGIKAAFAGPIGIIEGVVSEVKSLEAAALGLEQEAISVAKGALSSLTGSVLGALGTTIKETEGELSGAVGSMLGTLPTSQVASILGVSETQVPGAITGLVDAQAQAALISLSPAQVTSLLPNLSPAQAGSVILNGLPTQAAQAGASILNLPAAAAAEVTAQASTLVPSFITNLPPSVSSLLPASVTSPLTTTGTSSWSEPVTQYSAKFPYNKSQITESGHIIEFDDTPGHERIQIAHRSGTFIEMYPDGTVVQKSVKDNYRIVMKDDYLNVMGDCNITVQGDAKFYVEGNSTINTKGKQEISAVGEITIFSTDDVSVYGNAINVFGTNEINAYGDQININGGTSVTIGTPLFEVNALQFTVNAPSVDFNIV